tara:strand:+ start:133 stop:603 length:471 start_codon:yes stop_codon:yes gene_type:complete
MYNIKSNILILTLSIILLGCSQSATSVFNKDSIYAQNIQYSKVIKVINKDSITAIFNITYLNSVDSRKWGNNRQNFLIGTYTTDDNTSQYSLDMNGLKQLSSKEISKDDEIYKNIAFRNHWAKYNIITFNDTNEKMVTLTYTYSDNQNITTSFIKE